MPPVGRSKGGTVAGKDAAWPWLSRSTLVYRARCFPSCERGFLKDPDQPTRSQTRRKTKPQTTSSASSSQTACRSLVRSFPPTWRSDRVIAWCRIGTKPEVHPPFAPLVACGHSRHGAHCNVSSFAAHLSACLSVVHCIQYPADSPAASGRFYWQKRLHAISPYSFPAAL